MHTILVVDDMAIFRDPIAACLKQAGFKTHTASNGREALVVLRSTRVDLILLDLAMPVMDGLEMLRQVRSDPTLARVPVIVLTAVMDKPRILQAATLGVQDYMLKSRFSLKELLARIQKCLSAEGRAVAAPVRPAAQPPKQGDALSDAPGASAASGVKLAPANPLQSSCDKPQAGETPRQLLTREQAIARVKEAMQSKTLSGVVSQVLAMAGSPRSDVEDMCNVISKDPMLSTRILQAANSAAYASARGRATTILEAVRKIGLSTVRNIAAAIGIYNAIPATDADGFSPIRCWQHSFATAALCEHLAMQQPEHADAPGIPYLAGLCHDVGKILFHARFGVEYRQVLETQQRTGRPRAELEIAMLGLTQGELSSLILTHLALPTAISTPIEMLHSGLNNSSPAGRIARLLRLAGRFANGMLLASGPDSPINLLTRDDCRTAVGIDNPTAPDVQQMRNEIFVLTGMLARLSPAEEAKMMSPMFDHQSLRLCLVRDPAFSNFDPLATALESMAETQVTTRLPKADELTQSDGLVIATHNTTTPGFTPADVRRITAGSLPVFWLVTKTLSPEPCEPRATSLPTTLAALADFVSAVRTHACAAVPKPADADGQVLAVAA